MPPLRRLLVLPALLSGLCLTACAGTPQVVLAPNTKVPAELLKCSAEPTPPVIQNDTELTDWILDLSQAGQDCRDKLNAVSGIVGTP